MVDVKNAKRLIAKYAREEQQQWEDNLKQKGLWTQAQEKRSQRIRYKDDFDLYAQLEATVILPIEEGPRNFGGAGSISQSIVDAGELYANVQQDGETVSQRNLKVETVQMMPQDDFKSENDLGFMTEVDAEYINKNPGKESQNTGEVISTRHSEVDANTSVPNQRSSLLEIEKAEFKAVIKEIISKE